MRQAPPPPLRSSTATAVVLSIAAAHKTGSRRVHAAAASERWQCAEAARVKFSKAMTASTHRRNSGHSWSGSRSSAGPRGTDADYALHMHMQYSRVYGMHAVEQLAPPTEVPTVRTRFVQPRGAS